MTTGPAIQDGGVLSYLGVANIDVNHARVSFT